jgi:hypothetical protein
MTDYIKLNNFIDKNEIEQKSDKFEGSESNRDILEIKQN